VLLREEFGWSKTMLSAAFSMARAESGALGPIQGWLTDRFGPRALIRVGMVIFGLGLLLFSRIEGPVAFFLTFFMMAVGTSLGGQVLVRNWDGLITQRSLVQIQPPPPTIRGVSSDLAR
jgi:MFS family permease